MLFIYHPSPVSKNPACFLRLEEVSWALSTVLGTAVTIAGFVYYRFYQNMRNIFNGRRNEDYDEAQQIHSVTKIIQDVGSVEVGDPEY